MFRFVIGMLWRAHGVIVAATADSHNALRRLFTKLGSAILFWIFNDSRSNLDLEINYFVFLLYFLVSVRIVCGNYCLPARFSLVVIIYATYLIGRVSWCHFTTYIIIGCSRQYEILAVLRVWEGCISPELFWWVDFHWFILRNEDEIVYSFQEDY